MAFLQCSYTKLHCLSRTLTLTPDTRETCTKSQRGSPRDWVFAVMTEPLLPPSGLKHRPVWLQGNPTTLAGPCDRQKENTLAHRPSRSLLQEIPSCPRGPDPTWLPHEAQDDFWPFWNPPEHFQGIKSYQSKGIHRKAGIFLGHPADSISWVSDSWFQLRSWSQGPGIEFYFGLCTQQRVCLRFFLSFCLSPSLSLKTQPLKKE